MIGAGNEGPQFTQEQAVGTMAKGEDGGGGSEHRADEPGVQVLVKQGQHGGEKLMELAVEPASGLSGCPQRAIIGSHTKPPAVDGV